MDFGIALPTAADSLEGREGGRGAGLHPCLVLRHPDAERRLLRRHGRGGGEYQAHPARHRRAGAVQPHRAGRRQCAGDAEPARTRPHRFRRRHRLHRAARHGLRRDEAQGHGDLHPAGLRPAAPRDRRLRDGGRRQEDPLPQSRARPVQHQRIRSRCISRPSGRARRALTARLKAGWIDFVGKVENGVKEVRGDAPGVAQGRACDGRSLRHRLRPGLRAAGRRACRLRARHGAGRAARRRDAASRRRRSAGRPEAGRRHAVEARPKSRATSSWPAASSPRMRPISRTIADT